MENVSKNKIKWIRSLHQKKTREELNLYLVEGEKMIQELIESHPKDIEFICCTAESVLWKQSTPIAPALLSETDLKSISTMTNPNKSLAVVKKHRFSALQASFTLVLDTIQDPGNMGTIMRLADWFNVQEIRCSLETVDCYNPKVVQASMGAIFRIPITYCDLDAYLSTCDQPIYGALLEGENIYQQQLQPKGLLILGNEGNGISDAIKKHITHPITIPRFGKAESLNVSVATGILLSEFYRKEN